MAWLFDGGRGAPRVSVLTGVIAPAYCTPAYCTAGSLCARTSYALSNAGRRGAATSVALYARYEDAALWRPASCGESIGFAWASEAAVATNTPDSQYFARENPAFTISHLLNGTLQNRFPVIRKYGRPNGLSAVIYGRLLTPVEAKSVMP
jgi:hypothetical protein